MLRRNSYELPFEPKSYRVSLKRNTVYILIILFILLLIIGIAVPIVVYMNVRCMNATLIPGD